MFNQILGLFSTAATTVSVNPTTEQAIVEFKNGSKYIYSNVEGNAIYDLMFGNNRSLGQFINSALLRPEVDCVKLY